MEVTKTTVTEWLDHNKRTREWLAEQCGVKIAAIGHWLGKNSPRPIPAKAVLIIENLMQIDRVKEAAASVIPQNLVLEFTKEEFDTICNRAAFCEQTPREWGQDILNDMATKDARTIAKELKDFHSNFDQNPDALLSDNLSHAAEDPAPYGDEDK